MDSGYCVGPRIRRKQVSGGDRQRRRRTSFTGDQLRQLRAEYDRCRYITDDRRRQLADRLGLHVTTVKIWFQNRRASDKKASGVCNELALRLMAEGLYDHHTVDKTTTPTLWLATSDYYFTHRTFHRIARKVIPYSQKCKLLRRILWTHRNKATKACASSTKI